MHKLKIYLNVITKKQIYRMIIWVWSVRSARRPAWKTRGGSR